MPNRTHYTYRLYWNRRMVHGGITTDPKRREAEHQSKYPGSTLKIVSGPMTEAQARLWERSNRYT